MSPEKVKIAEIDIGVDKLVAKAGEVKKRIEELRQSQKELKKDTDNLTNATSEQLEQYTLAEVELKNLSKEHRNSTKVLDAYINLQNQDIRTKEQARDANLKLMAIVKELDTTNEDHSKLISKINKEIDTNTDFIKKNSSEYEKTKINIGNYKESIKEALGELNIFGKYQQGVNDVMKGSGPIITFVSTNLKQIKTDFNEASTATTGMSKAQIAAHLTTTALVTGMKLLRLALIATGIGAFVVLVGSLVTYLVSTQEGIDKVNRVLTPLKEVFGTLLGVIQKFGKSLFDAFSNPKKLITDIGNSIKQNLINRFAALGKMISAVMDGDIKGMKDAFLQGATGVEDITGKIQKMGAEAKQIFGEAIARGKEIEGIKQNLAKTEAAFITQQAILRKEFELQKKLAEDVNKPIAEREAAAQKAIEAQEEISKGAIHRIKQEAQLLKLKQMANDTSDSEKAELATKLAEIDKALEEEAAKTTEAQNKLNSIRKEGATAAIAQQQKVLDAALQRQKEELDLYVAQQGLKAKTLQEEIAIAEQISQKKLAILDREYQAGKVSKTAYETEKLNITQEFARLQAEAAIANAERELEIFKQNHQSKLDTNQFLSEELFNQEQERLNKIAEAEREFQQKKLEEGLINQEQFNAAIAQVDLDSYNRQEELRNEREAAKKEKAAFELAIQQELEMEQFETRFQQEREQAERKYQAELAEAERLGADKAAIEAKYAEVRKEINQLEQDAVLSSSENTFGEVSKLLGEKTAMGKAAGLAEAYINTYQGVTQVWAAPSVLPEPLGTAQKVISTGVVLASGLKSAKQIAQTKIPRAEKGIVMDLEGPSHSQGGINLYDESGRPLVNAQGGEKLVILKREASKELASLSALNQKHGGVSLSKPVRHAASGGAVIRNPQMPASIKMPKELFDYEMLGSVLADRVNAIQSVVPVDQITNVARKAAQVEQGANL